MNDSDHILDFEPTDQPVYNPDDHLASTGNRLANYFLDSIGLNILMYFIMFLFGGAASVMGEEILLVAVVAVLLCVPGYYIGFEYLLGKTPAKFLTKTKVVDMNGQKPTIGAIVGRSFARMIPFEPFSFLGSRPVGWHDSLSGTRVVEDY